MHIRQSFSSSNASTVIPISQFNRCPQISPISSVCFESNCFPRRSQSAKVLGLLKRQRNFCVENLRINGSRMTNQCVEGSNSNYNTDEFVEVGNKIADAAGQLIRQYFRQRFDILDKEDLSPVTIADRAAEEAMRSVIAQHFPTHAIFGEENGWTCNEENAEYVWVLDPIDGTKSFITGKPLFGTLIALVHKGIPIVGIIDQPILGERWIGKLGEKSTFNGKEISTRLCKSLSKAYMYTTSPHLFKGEAEEAYGRVRNKVKVPLYGCDCYAYALLASGHVDLVIESGLKPYDFMALIPVIEGAGGIITDWKGNKLSWNPSSDGHFPDFNVIAAGDAIVYQEALSLLQWK
uniref:histidinol-phosphatase n=1 Tax=Araucaria cunninghamii TaxID=56994 RepID=A0A0D6R426_ARACU